MLTLEDVQSACCDKILAPHMLRTAPQSDNAPLAARTYRSTPATDSERLAVRTIVADGVSWFAWNQPDRASAKTWHRFRNDVTQSANESVSRVCGFGFVIGAILAWLIEKALDWLWDWWKGTPKSNALVCGMVAPA